MGLESNLIRAIGSSPIKELSLRKEELVREGRPIQNLGQGIPYQAPPERVLQAIYEANYDSNGHKYSGLYGNQDLREGLGERYGAHPDQILITGGAMAACKTVFESFLAPGLKAAVISPNYATHYAQLQLLGCEVKDLQMDEGDRWNVVLDEIEEYKPDLLLLTNPGNPTGVNFSREELERINELSKKHNFVVVSDETYGYLTYDGAPFTSMTEIDNQNPRNISIGSFSKEYRMTGDRVGFIIANDRDVVKYLARAHDANVGTVNNYAQKGALAALYGHDETEDHGEYYYKRAMVAEQIANIPSLRLTPGYGPEGAYYAFPKYDPALGISSIALCNYLLEQYNVVVIPGDAFGKGGENHFRISYATDVNTLAQGLANLEAGMNDLYSR